MNGLIQEVRVIGLPLLSVTQTLDPEDLDMTATALRGTASMITLESVSRTLRRHQGEGLHRQSSWQRSGLVCLTDEHDLAR